ncbi:MAG TPA: hypothetical protein VK752_03645 [Bryobacteraceae bacterium]|jgi:hypothetical protein|nr:hypothetical protein [Bryobacteraceae bacterium]
MNDKFNQHCRRRLHTRPLIQHFGAGSGGGPGVIDTASGDKYLAAQKELWLVGNQVHLQTGTSASAETPEEYVIEMLAIDPGFDNGRIEMRGSQSVRITSGVQEGSGGPKISNKKNNGVVIRAGDGQVVALAQGCDEEVDSAVVLNPQGAGGILLNSKEFISIDSGTQILLSVAGGTSSITLTPSGIVMKGPIIRIN